MIRTAVFAAAALSWIPACDPEPKIVEGSAVDHGEALFKDPSVAGTTFNQVACSTCHEAEPGDAGEAILPGAPLAGAVERPSYWGGREPDLLAAINHCLYYFMLKVDPWSADDVEARAMYAYLDSLPRDDADTEAVAFTPVYTLRDPSAGDAAKGGVLYDKACRVCHGAARTGEGRLVGHAPVLPDQTLEEHPPDKYSNLDRRLVFVEKIRHGGFVGYGGQMPPFSAERLSEADMADLLTFFDLPE